MKLKYYGCLLFASYFLALGIENVSREGEAVRPWGLTGGRQPRAGRGRVHKYAKEKGNSTIRL